MADSFRDELQAALGTAYDLDRELTGAGMSRVFVATERALGRRVVVKVLPPDFAAGVNSERFRREIQLAAQLQHPHIVPLLAAGEHGRLLYYTMPFIEGESLRATLDRQGPFPVREVLRILTDVVEALVYAHERGVIHRDIKPGNVLMQGPHALITDFGVAKALNAALPSGGGTSSGMAIGTPSYMAPEQLAGDPAADHRVDLYAVGLLAYELVTGKSPFAGPSPQATMAAQLTRMPDPLDRSHPDVPPRLAHLVSACLQKHAEGRPRTARELLDQLERLTTPASGGLRIAIRPAGRRRMVALAAITGTILAVGAAAGAIAMRWEGAVGEVAPPPDAPRLALDSAIVTDLESPRRRDTVYISQPPPTSRLTRDDSLSIAAAVETRRRELSGSGIAQRALDSVVRIMTRQLADSMEKMSEVMIRLRGLQTLAGRLESPPTPPRGREEPRPETREPVRVMVLDLVNGGGQPALDTVSRLVTDSLRRVLGQHERLRVLSPEVSRRMQSVQGKVWIERQPGTPTVVETLPWNLLVVEGTSVLVRDSVEFVFQIKSHDRAAVTVVSRRAPVATPTAHLDGAFRRIQSTLLGIGNRMTR